MFNYLQKKGIVFAILVLGVCISLQAQPCDGQEEDLLDTEIPVTRVSSANPEAYCLYFRFDSDVTGNPIGITMDLWHEYEGDLSIFVEACGETLNVMQRPGAIGNCGPGCSLSDAGTDDCGSSAEIGTQDEPEIITFLEAGPDPENGISAGGVFGLTTDDACGVSTLSTNSFAELWSNCPVGLVEAEICFTDHALRHRGYVSNLNFIFPNPYVCGCMDPDAVNYNPDANVSTGGCLYECPDLGIGTMVSEDQLCSGGDTVLLTGSATLAVGPSYEWISLNGQDFMANSEAATTEVYIPTDFEGELIYTLTVTDQFGCQEVDAVTINVVAGPDGMLLGGEALCLGDSTWLSVSGGPFDSTSWSTGASTDSIRVPPGNYAVTLTNGGICQRVLTTSVDTLSLPVPVIMGEDTICFGATTILSADTTFTTYEWNNRADTTFITATEAGLYSLTVTDANGCSDSTNFLLTTYDSLIVNIAAPTAFCTGEAIMLSATAGYDSYLWSTGDTLATITTTEAGTFSVTVTDQFGCQASTATTVTMLPTPDGTLIGTSAVCLGDSTWLSISGGPFDAVSWSNGASTDSIFVPAGNYAVTLTDGICQSTLNTLVGSLPLPEPSIMGEDTICFGTSTTLAVTTPFPTYAWSNQANNNSITVSESGTYGLTVTDGNNCSGSTAFVLATYDSLLLDITGADAFCAGDSVVLSATAGYDTYAWSTGDTASTLTVTEAGIYSVTVTTTNACTATASFSVSENPLPIPMITSPAALCPDSIAILETAQDYATYNWSTNENTPSISVNTPATYGLTIVDALGCNGSGSFELVTSDPIVADIMGDLLFCQGDSTLLTATPGFASYQWSDGTSESTLMADQANTYTLTITNAQGCGEVLSVSLNNHPIQSLSISGVSELCAGESTVLTADSSFSNYVWSTGATGPTLSVATSGMYSVSATDSNGCQSIAAPFGVTVRAPLEPQIGGDTSICADGDGLLTAPAGFSTYAWTGGGVAHTLMIDAPGTYELTVTDDLTCTGTTQVAVTETVLLPSIEGAANFCLGGSTQLSVADTFQTYQWMDGPATSNYEVSTAGNYSLTVTDAEGCSVSTSIDIGTWPLPTPTIAGDLTFCEGDNTTLSAGETYPNYAWSVAGQITASLTATEAGTYTLTVTDTNGCQGNETVMVGTLPLPTPQIVGQLQFCPDGSTTLSSDQDFVSYSWSTGETTNEILTGTVGSVSLTVIDDNNCSGSTSVATTLFATEEPSILGEDQFCLGETTSLSASGGDFVTYNWSNGQTTPSIITPSTETIGLTVTDANTCSTSTSLPLSNFTPANLVITAPAGFCVDENATLMVADTFTNYQWSAGTTTAAFITDMAGTFSLVATDNNGCLAYDTVAVESYPLPTPVIDGLLSICANSSTTLSVSGGDFVSYNWTTGEETATVEIDAIGSVSVIVTDMNGCSSATEETITEVAVLMPEIAGNLSLCPGESTVLQPLNDYTSYEWSDGSTADSLLVSAAGNYELTVTNSQGCQGTASLQVLANDSPTVGISGMLYFCSGASTTLASSSDMVSYAWSTGENSSSIEVTDEGTYSLTVTDANGCSATVDQNVNERELPNFSLLGESIFCADSTSVLNVVPEYPTYSWSTGENTQSINVSSPGTIGVAVTDAFGCTASETLELNTVPNPIAIGGDDQTLDCAQEQVQLGSSLTSQGDDLEIVWTGPGITATNANEAEPTVDQAGSYSLLVTNTAYGCVSMPAEVTVNNLAYEPQVLLSVLNILDCNTSSVLIDGTNSDSGPQFVYQWYNGDEELIPGATDMSYEAIFAQEYTLTILDTITSCAAEQAILVEAVENYPQVDAGPDQELNCGQPTVTLTGNVLPAEDFIELQWTGPAGTIIAPDNELTAAVVNTGWYFLQATDINNGCTAIDSVLVTANFVAPTVLLSDDVVLSCDETSTLLSGQGSSVGNNYSYQWLLNGQEISSANGLQFQANTPGTYTLQITDESNNCSTSATVNVSLDPTAPQSMTVNLNPPTCAGEMDGSIAIEGVLGGLSPYLFSLNGAPFVANTLFTGLGAGSYTIVAEDANGCQITTEVVLNDGNDVYIDLGDDQVIQWGETADLYPFISIDSTQLSQLNWTPAGLLNCETCIEQEDIALTQSTIFQLSIADENGCSATDEVVIIVEKDRDIFIPNVFSPNGDGTNDRFFINSDWRSVKTIREMKIFNRWGEHLYENYDFQPNNPSEGWDGRMRGEVLNPAVFVWYAIIEFVDGEVKLFEGDVVLVK